MRQNAAELVSSFPDQYIDLWRIVSTIMTLPQILIGIGLSVFIGVLVLLGLLVVEIVLVSFLPALRRPLKSLQHIRGDPQCDAAITSWLPVNSVCRSHNHLNGKPTWRKIMQFIKCWIVSLLGMMVFSGNARSQDDRGLPSPLKAVFVYADGKRDAEEFAKLLKPRRIDTQIVQASDLSEELFTDKHLIIVGADTFRVWGFRAADDLIRHANLPVLGMGEGGYKLFGELDLNLADFQTSRGEATAVRPVKQSIFWDGFQLPLVDGVHECFVKSKQISIQLEDATDTALPIATADGRDRNFALIVEKPHYFFWGFDGTPDQMTKTGRELLCWACYYTVATKRRPDRAFMSVDEVQRIRNAK